MLNVFVDGALKADRTLILAHGAGVGKEHYFMNFFASELATDQFRVVRFDFPYMARARLTGKKIPPDRQITLIASWQETISKFRTKELIIGGKSLGGRIASMIADTEGADGLVCLGYPFHAPGKLDNPRVEHLRSLQTPTLICQGTRDPFGNKNDVGTYKLSEKIFFNWVKDGDHSFKPRKSSGLTEADNLSMSLKAVETFSQNLFEDKKR
ncbi:MAG: alpha/beta hydrolase [Rhodospirillaceae bacterium]|nr:alpha/beta hydrolase [Rhodospirillaceae bacterium]|tara:strand:- start:103 stop:735 length:633 start_codon:yes stop_codon:yes gene_type:complete